MAAGWRKDGGAPPSYTAKGGYVPTYLRTHVPTDERTHETYVAPTEHATRAFDEHEVAARAWQQLSRFPKERGIAATRFRAYARDMDPELLLAALSEVASQGYSARAFNRQVARDRVANIRVRIYEGEKRKRASEDHSLISLARQMRAAGLPLGVLGSFLR